MSGRPPAWVCNKHEIFDGVDLFTQASEAHTVSVTQLI